MDLPDGEELVLALRGDLLFGGGEQVVDPLKRRANGAGVWVAARASAIHGSAREGAGGGEEITAPKPISR